MTVLEKLRPVLARFGGAERAPTALAAPPGIPRRHGADLDHARRLAKPLLWGLANKGEAEPTSAQWRELGVALTKGDPLADAVAVWMPKVGAPAGWKRLEQGLAHGAASVRADAALCALLTTAERDPAWLDRAALARGQEVSARAGATGMRVLRDLGLMAGYRASAINQTLVRTGALEGSAQRRVAQTTGWWMACTERGGLVPGGAGFGATLRVRVVHAQVRRNLSRSPQWDSGYLGLPVNQLDMQATYLAFSVLYLLGQRALGVRVSAAEAEDVMHLWRYIGWLMGVDESLLVASERDGRIALFRNLLSQPSADETSRQLGRALMDEPLDRIYPDWAWLRGRWNKHAHLSVVRYFVGREGMDALGLPTWVLPWFPLLSAPPNFVVSSVARVIPGGRERLSRRGRATQKALFETLKVGGRRPTLRIPAPLRALERQLGQLARRPGGV